MNTRFRTADLPWATLALAAATVAASAAYLTDPASPVAPYPGPPGAGAAVALAAFQFVCPTPAMLAAWLVAALGVGSVTEAAVGTKRTAATYVAAIAACAVVALAVPAFPFLRDAGVSPLCAPAAPVVALCLSATRRYDVGHDGLRTFLSLAVAAVAVAAFPGHVFVPAAVGLAVGAALVRSAPTVFDYRP